jgi:transcriptional regulator with XRE-family HTH domain
MDLVLRLRELRRLSGLPQVEVARRAGVGVKTLSSFETGARIESLKVSQLTRILGVYGVTQEQFFHPELEAAFGDGHGADVVTTTRNLGHLSPRLRQAIVDRIEMMIETACVAAGVSFAGPAEATNRSDERHRWSSR